MASESPLADKKARIAYNKALREKGVPAKACSACFAVKAFSQFNKDAGNPDGRQARCRDCNRAACAKWNSENTDRKREYMRRWYEANAESQREYKRRWHEANAESRREYNRRWREANPDYSRQWHAANPEYRRQWCAENPERARAYVQRRRARKAAATVEDFTPAELFAAWDDAAIYDCFLCGLPFSEDDEVHHEHVVPLARGGTHGIANLLPAHARCNIQKGTADPLDAWHRIQRKTHGDSVADARMRYVQAHMD